MNFTDTIRATDGAKVTAVSVKDQNDINKMAEEIQRRLDKIKEDDVKYNRAKNETEKDKF